MSNSLTLPVKGQTISLGEKLQQKNEFFSAIGGFAVTNLQVIILHAVMVFLLMGAILAGHHNILALICAAFAGWGVYHLNLTDYEEDD